MPATEARLDKWLWCVRIFRTRSLATAACQEGRIQVNQQPAKPARSVRPGDLITAEQGGLTRTLKVRGLPDSRVGAKLVPHHLEDLTPPEELAKPRERQFTVPGYRPKGAGRPTKRDRRVLTRFFGDPEPE
jgi:ribosome-associated heat shock protein Hsp15